MKCRVNGKKSQALIFQKSRLAILETVFGVSQFSEAPKN